MNNMINMYIKGDIYEPTDGPRHTGGQRSLNCSVVYRPFPLTPKGKVH
jgi:hypothetical protein